MLVKKYGNRRLYDTEESRYVRLDEIAERIRGGADVQVVDAKSGADLTAPALAQIIFEDRNAARLLPVPLLLQLIRMGDGPLADFLGRYVSWALEMYLQARSGLGRRSTTRSRRSAASPLPAPQTLPARRRPARAAPRDEVAELRREVAALRKSLKQGSHRAVAEVLLRCNTWELDSPRRGATGGPWHSKEPRCLWKARRETGRSAHRPATVEKSPRRPPILLHRNKTPLTPLNPVLQEGGTRDLSGGEHHGSEDRLYADAAVRKRVAQAGEPSPPTASPRRWPRRRSSRSRASPRPCRPWTRPVAWPRRPSTPVSSSARSGARPMNEVAQRTVELRVPEELSPVTGR